MSVAKVARRSSTHLNRYDIEVLKVPISGIIQRDGGWKVGDGIDIEVIDTLTNVRGERNSAARLAKMAERHGATALEDDDAVEALVKAATPPPPAAPPASPEASPSPSPSPAPAAKAARTPSGYKLFAWLPAWGMVKGKERWYSVGLTPTLSRVQHVQQRWTDAGYVTQVKPTHTRKTVVDNLWDEPSEPIVSRIPDDPWVGDHLGPHLRAMGMTMAQYREVYNYTGPAMVNNAARSLSKAHKKVRSVSSIRIGMFVCEVHGDNDVTVHKVAKSSTKESVTLVSVSGTRHKDGSTKQVKRGELVTSAYQPVGHWTKRVKDKENTDD